MTLLHFASCVLCHKERHILFDNICKGYSPDAVRQFCSGKPEPIDINSMWSMPSHMASTNIRYNLVLLLCYELAYTMPRHFQNSLHHLQIARLIVSLLLFHAETSYISSFKVCLLSTSLPSIAFILSQTEDSFQTVKSLIVYW